MKLIIFSDIDGTFMNHYDYSYKVLKKTVSNIKKNHELIFNSSKTFAEINVLSKDLGIRFPFIAENGACIFFPDDYFDKISFSKSFFRHKNYIGYSLSKKKKNYWYEIIKEIRKKFNLIFFFLEN